MFVGSTLINRPFENNRKSWDNNIRADLKKYFEDECELNWLRSLSDGGIRY